MPAKAYLELIFPPLSHSPRNNGIQRAVMDSWREHSSQKFWVALCQVSSIQKNYRSKQKQNRFDICEGLLKSTDKQA